MVFSSHGDIVIIDRSRFIYPLSYSFVFHLTLFLMLAFVFFADLNPFYAAEDELIKVSLLEDDNDQSIKTGRIVDINQKSDDEKSHKSEVLLSRSDTLGKNVGKDKENSSSKIRLNKKIVEPYITAIERSDINRQATANKSDDTKIRSITGSSALNPAKIEPILPDRYSSLESTKLKRLNLPDNKLKAWKETKREGEKISDKLTYTEIVEPESDKSYQGEREDNDILDDTDLALSNGYLDLGTEALVSINTTRFEFIDYFSNIKKSIESNLSYPEQAMQQKMKGTVNLVFSVRADGSLENVRLIKSSNAKFLDDEAIAAIKGSAPFPHFPKDLKKEKIHIVSSFEYSPTYRSATR